MPDYRGACHCGAVQFAFHHDEAISHGLRCNCSLCRRKGAMMTPFVIAPQHFHIDAEPGALGLYQFGAGTARHHFCTRCGIYTFHVTARVPDHYRANLGCIEGVDTFSLDVELFDGAHLL